MFKDNKVNHLKLNKFINNIILLIQKLKSLYNKDG